MHKFVIIALLSMAIVMPAHAQDRCAIEAETWNEAALDLRVYADSAFENLMASNTLVMADAKQDAASIGILLLNFDGVFACDDVQERINAYHEFAYWALLVSSIMTDAELQYIAASADEYDLIDNMAQRVTDTYYNLDTPYNFGNRS